MAGEEVACGVGEKSGQFDVAEDKRGVSRKRVLNGSNTTERLSQVTHRCSSLRVWG